MTAAIPDWHDALHRTEATPSTVENIILPLDGSPGSRRAVPIGRRLAQIYDATIHFVYAGERTSSPRDAAERLGLTDEDMHGAVVDHHDGEPAEVILAAVQQLGRPMIVMCANTGHHVGPDCFGSVTEAVLAATPDRVVLVGPECGDTAWRLRRVLLAHDGTPSSDLATAPAAEVAQRAGAVVIALHVAAGGDRYRKQPHGFSAPRYIDQPQHEWPSWADEFTNRMLALGAPRSAVSFKLVVTGGQPGSEVVQVSREREADLVVMAWHGRWDPPQSPTKVVVRTAGCPVLLVYSAR